MAKQLDPFVEQCDGDGARKQPLSELLTCQVNCKGVTHPLSYKEIYIDRRSELSGGRQCPVNEPPPEVSQPGSEQSALHQPHAAHGVLGRSAPLDAVCEQLLQSVLVSLELKADRAHGRLQYIEARVRRNAKPGPKVLDRDIVHRTAQSVAQEFGRKLAHDRVQARFADHD